MANGSSPVLAPRMTPGVKQLLIANVVIYVAYLLMLRTDLAWLAHQLPLNPRELLLEGRLWQPLTYMLIHSPLGPGHLLGNLLWLFFFGTTVEQMLGTRRFYWVYLLCGLGGAAMTILVGFLGAQLAPNSGLAAIWDSPHLGASGAVQGLVLCWGGMLWNQTVNFFLLGPMRVRTFVLILVGIELLVILGLSGDTSYTTHLGGMLVGFLIGRGKLPLPGRKSAPSRSRQTEESGGWSGLRQWFTRRRHQRTQERLRKFEVIEGGRKGDKPEDGANKHGWGRRDDDDSVVH